MMILSVKATHSEGPSTFVSWYVGADNKGTLEISMEGLERDQQIAAELCAVRYLVFRKQVFNVFTKFGQGIVIRVSSGAIRKLINGTSTKKHLRAYASFTKPRLNEAQFTISKQDLPHDASNGSTEKLSLNDIFSSWHEPIDIPSIGKTHITNHALERYVERAQQPEMKEPLESMYHRMRHEEFCQLQIPDHVKKEKARKYGYDQNIEVWGNPQSTLRFLVSRDLPGQATLLTVFRVSQNF